MGVSTVAVIWLLLLELCIASDIVIVESNTECESTTNTLTLYQALQNISSDTIISLANGIHCIDHVSYINSIDNITITGPESTDDAIILCSDGSGLVFHNISNLSIRNIQIIGCGITGDDLMSAVNLTHEMIRLYFIIPSDTTVAVYASSIYVLSMNNVTITNTTGLGLVGINIVGYSMIEDCQFTHNIQQQEDCAFTNQSGYVTDRGKRIGGGAYFLFQDFTGYDVEKCDNISFYSLNVTNNHFTHNSECSDLTVVEFNYRDSERAKTDGYTIGGAGGMGVMFAQACYAINVTVTDTVFEENYATLGGGSHIGIFQGVSHSYVIFDDCHFNKNGLSTDKFDLNSPTSGGAIGLYNDLVSPNKEVPVFIHNRSIGLIAKNTKFIDNGAINGGAIIIISLVTTAVADIADVAYFYLDNCTFLGNRAVRGSAVFIQELKLHARILGVQVKVSDLTMIHNRIESLGSTTSIASVDSSAIFEIRAINMTLSGDCLIESNTGSGLQGRDSFIGIAGNIIINNNTGFYGAGITLRLSFLIILPNASLTIMNNVARVFGGGLFVNQINNSPLVFMFDCFLLYGYNQLDYCESCDFARNNFTITFINNTAILGGTVYGSALTTCPWAVQLTQKYNEQNVLEILQDHFSDHFQFSPYPTGIENVQTPVTNVTIENEQDIYTLAPGQALFIPLRPQDSLGQSISSILGVYPDLDQDIPSTFFGFLGAGVGGYAANTDTSTRLTVVGAENITVNMIIYSLDLIGNRPAQNLITVYVTECPIGFEYSTTSLKCVCSEELLDRNVRCNTSDLTITVPSNVWVGPIEGSRFAVADCIRGLCEPGEVTISVSNNSVDFDLQCRQDLNRGGALCGECIDQYCNVFGSVRCIKCSNRSTAIILLFLILGALLIAFLVIFPINLSSGYLNGILFWSNIVSIYENVLSPSQTHARTGFLANWLTLNWGIETCFHQNMTALERSWWELSFPLYLFILMLILRSLFKCKCCRVGSKTAFATIEAFATLLLMCYISILQYSVQLISTVEIYTDDGDKLIRWNSDPTVSYFNGPHGLLAFVACVLIAVYVVPIPIISLFPAFLYKSKFLKRYKPFYDAVWNPFKPRYRFWLGLRLIFRWIPLILASFSTPPTSTFVTAFFLIVLLFLQLQLQPFQSKLVNGIDSLFLLNLILIFLGSLFYNATEQNDLRQQQITIMNRATIFTTTFQIIAYIGIFILFIFSLFVRFPKMKECFVKCYTKCCTKKMKKIIIRVPQSLPGDTDYIAGVPNPITSEERQRPRVIGHTFFRESLLEDSGSVEIQTYTQTVSPKTNIRINTSE